MVWWPDQNKKLVCIHSRHKSSPSTPPFLRHGPWVVKCVCIYIRSPNLTHRRTDHWYQQAKWSSSKLQLSSPSSFSAVCLWLKVRSVHLIPSLVTRRNGPYTHRKRHNPIDTGTTSWTDLLYFVKRIRKVHLENNLKVLSYLSMSVYVWVKVEIRFIPKIALLIFPLVANNVYRSRKVFTQSLSKL